MNTLSTGEPNTLGTWLKIATALAGSDSRAAKFFQDKIAESPHGEDEEVIQHESQMLLLVGHLMKREDAA